ncbi:hypothetical protein Y032_0068g273 [Ancylostoma ceylanicum]|uniref:Uncharacterized protein n=1 Tax=Ancylostoma ceylanicum TaxID=53326 RepID=A0A016U0E1_9BILA|nr:hypothetical protein Y032_0068g273 [Ancylostoma ceylanicum]
MLQTPLFALNRCAQQRSGANRPAKGRDRFYHGWLELETKSKASKQIWKRKTKKTNVFSEHSAFKDTPKHVKIMHCN